MSIAKYLEDISDRYFESVAPAAISYSNPKPEITSKAGEVYLSNRGQRMEDIAVFELGQILNLIVVSTPGAADPTVEIQDNIGRNLLKINSPGIVSVPCERSGVFHLMACSGGYIKRYEIHVVEKNQFSQLPDFAQPIHNQSENSWQWSQESFELFQISVESILRNSNLPELFIRGIKEYHLGLFHEDKRVPDFRHRYQTAHGFLRLFIPFSDIARLICAYYHYCANEFEVASQLVQGNGSRMGKAISFFKGHAVTDCSSNKTYIKQGSGLPLLLNMSDALTFQAVEAITDGRYEHASELAATIQRNTLPSHDRERVARLRLLDAYIKFQTDRTASISLFEELRHSPWQSIAMASETHLKKINHG